MKKLILFGFILLSLLLTSCAAPKVVLPKYKNSKILNKTVGFSIDEIFFEDRERVEKIFAEDLEDDNRKLEEIAIEYIIKELDSEINEFSTLSFAELVKLNKTDYTKRSLKLTESENIFIEIPENGANINTSKNFVVFIENLNTYYTPGSSGSYTPGMGHTGGSFATYSLSCDYVIWNTEVGELVSYGKCDASSTCLTTTVKKKHLKTSIKKLTKQIITKTPFDNYPVNEFNNSKSPQADDI